MSIQESPSSKDVILQINNLTKSFGNVKAVDDISFSILRGEFFAFLGTNGAGKSTTINIITTLLQQDSGNFYLNNIDNDKYIRSKIGVVFQDNILDNILTVKQNLMIRGALYIQDKKELKKRYNQLVQQLNFKHLENKQFKTLSGGEKRRIEIARALFANPEILFLDEPTTGLDPESRKVMWSIIEQLKKQNDLTIFLTTHYMEETNNADYVVIINKGKIVAKGKPSQLKTQYANDVFKVIPKDKDQMKEYLEKNNIQYKIIADQLEISIKNSEQAIEILSSNKENITTFEFIKGTMNDVFLNIVEKI